MKDIVHFEPLSLSKYKSYIKVGIRAYNQHYLHLWPNEDPSPYIESSFTKEVLQKEESDSNTIRYLIKLNEVAVGIFKITLNCALGSFAQQVALYVDKIYILKEHSGKSIGRKVLRFVILRAQEMGKEIIWLDTMQNGPALNFYLKNGFEIYGESRVELPNVLPEESFMYIMTKKISR